MQWHAQPTSLTLRLYDTPGGYDRREAFRAVAQVELLGDGRAFIHAFLRADGTAISRGEWRQLRDLLRAEHGVTEILAERHGKDEAYDTAPAPL